MKHDQKMIQTAVVLRKYYNIMNISARWEDMGQQCDVNHVLRSNQLDVLIRRKS